MVSVRESRASRGEPSRSKALLPLLRGRLRGEAPRYVCRKAHRGSHWSAQPRAHQSTAAEQYAHQNWYALRSLSSRHLLTRQLTARADLPTSSDVNKKLRRDVDVFPLWGNLADQSNHVELVRHGAHCHARPMMQQRGNARGNSHDGLRDLYLALQALVDAP